MRRRILPLILFVLFPGTLCGQTNQLAYYDDAAAYEIYSSLLSASVTGESSRTPTLIILLETSDSFGSVTDTEHQSICLRPDAESGKLIGPAISDYLKVNKTKWRLKRNLTLTFPYQLVAREKIFSLGWNGFYKQYPGSAGYLSLSAVGFNLERSIAIVSIASNCGYLCGEGRYHVLQKKDGKWIPLEWKGEYCTWVS